jgi:stage V sporulation protein B
MKKTSLGHGTLYITISTLIFVGSGYVINIILGRYLGPASYGIYGIITTLMTIINLTQTSGLPLAVAKYIAEDESKSDAVLKSGLILQIISTFSASIIFYFFAAPISLFLKDESLIPYIQAVAGVFPLYGIYSIYLNYYNGQHFFRKQSIISTAYAIAKLFTVIGFVYLFNLYGAIIGFIISPLIAILFGLHIPKGIKHNFSYKKLIFFSLPLIVSAIFITLLQSVNLFFIKSLLQSNVDTGYYTANQNIASIPFFGITALASVLFPSISKSVSLKLYEQTKNLIRKSLRFSLMIIAPSVLIISATSHQILSFIYSSAYSEGTESLSILVIANGFFTFYIVLSSILSSSGSPTIPAIISIVGLLINTLLCYLLIPIAGITGAAISTAIATLATMIISSIVVYIKFKTFFSYKSIFNILFASAIVFIIAKLVFFPVILLPLIYIILFSIYILILHLLKEIKPDDIKTAKSMLPNWVIAKFKNE